MSISKRIVDDLVANDISFVTTVPCKQLAGVIDEALLWKTVLVVVCWTAASQCGKKIFEIAPDELIHPDQHHREAADR